MSKLSEKDMDTALEQELNSSLTGKGDPEPRVIWASGTVGDADDGISSGASGNVGAQVQPRLLPAGFEPMPSVPGYNVLATILAHAYLQAATGKGKERHSVGPVGFQPWHLQPILANARQVGPAGPSMQVMKKAGESVTMSVNGNYKGAKAEALGAIVYAAALYQLYCEMEEASGSS